MRCIVLVETSNIIAMSLVGMGYNGVVTYLNNNGIKKKARQNGHLTSFTTSTVKAILDNPVYAGKIAYERRKNTKIEGTRNEYHIVPQKEYPVYDGKHEAIIDLILLVR